MMKFKTNKYLQKDQEQKLKIKRIWTEFEISTTKMIKQSFQRKKREKKQKKEESLTNDKLTTQLQQALSKEKEDATTLTMTQ